MKTYTLKNHNDTKKSITIKASFELKKNHLKLKFNLKGDLKAYLFPKPMPQQRADELWKKTCFELFITNCSTTDYYELNISPSMSWNIYHFDNYKQNMKSSDIIDEPFMSMAMFEDEFMVSFDAFLDSDLLEDEIEFNLATVLLDKEGKRHFYAINRREGMADFHDKGLFLKNKLR